MAKRTYEVLNPLRIAGDWQAAGFPAGATPRPGDTFECEESDERLALFIEGEDIKLKGAKTSKPKPAAKPTAKKAGKKKASKKKAGRRG